MKVSLVDVDGRNFPNLALMRISAWHKAQGDTVYWYMPMFSRPDRIYASKVFTFSPDAEIAAGLGVNTIRHFRNKQTIRLDTLTLLCAELGLEVVVREKTERKEGK